MSVPVQIGSTQFHSRGARVRHDNTDAILTIVILGSAGTGARDDDGRVHNTIHFAWRSSTPSSARFLGADLRGTSLLVENPLVDDRCTVSGLRWHSPSM